MSLASTSEYVADPVPSELPKKTDTFRGISSPIATSTPRIHPKIASFPTLT